MGFDRDNLHISVVKRMGGPQELFADLITQKQDTGKPECQHAAAVCQLLLSCSLATQAAWVCLTALCCVRGPPRDRSLTAWIALVCWKARACVHLLFCRLFVAGNTSPPRRVGLCCSYLLVTPAQISKQHVIC